MNPVLATAMSAHQGGRLVEAESAYRRVLRREPANVDALHYLGVLLYHNRQKQAGVDSVRRSLALDPGNPHAWNNLGNMLTVNGDLPGAREAFGSATRLDEGMHAAWYNLGVVHRRLRDADACIECFRRAVALRPDYEAAYESLGMLYYRIGNTALAHAAYRDWLRVSPTNPVARHMAAATAGLGTTPTRADDAYIRATFDAFAESFDENLGKLEYRAPELVAAALQDHAEYQSGEVDVLDAGCGTGLCGPLLRSTARRLVGVDLSKGMIDRARQRTVYDELVIEELCSAMRARPAAFGVVVSADTLVYFGALEEALAACEVCLRGPPSGLLSFTVEAWPGELEGPPYELQASGRYRHTRAYVEGALRASGFHAVQVTPAVLRKELDRDVSGWVVVA